MTFTNTRISNNIIANGVLLVIEKNVDTSGLALTNNMEKTNPKFVAPQAFDFHLRPDSPAIDTGLSLSEAAEDHRGCLRPQGEGQDIGAYEYPGPFLRAARLKTKSDAKPAIADRKKF
jgi:hypothetical protein